METDKKDKKNKTTDNLSSQNALKNDSVLVSQPPINFLGKHRRSSLLISGFSLLVIAVLLYLFLSPYFVRIRIGKETAYGGKTESAYQEIIRQQIQGYKLRVQYSSGNIKAYSLSSIGIYPNYNETINNIKSSYKSTQSRLRLWNTNQINISLIVNRNKLEAFSKSNLNEIIVPPKNANIALSNGQIILTDDSVGKEYGFSGGSDAPVRQAQTLNDSIIKLKVISVNPPITTDQLANQEPELKKIINQRVVLGVAGNESVVSPATLSTWINLSVTPEGKINTSVNSSSVETYLNSLAYYYTRPVKDQVVLTGSDGSSNIVVPGQDGISITDEKTAAQSIISSILTGNGVTASVGVSTVPFQTITSSTYPKWIEVDVSTKRMYVYEYANLVNTFLVSAGKPSTPTPLGEFHILSKIPLQTMVGADYVQPDVPWINYFKSGGYAIHGNYWRPASYFGNINSSHGCVGLQVSDALWVYNWAPLGTPIIIHS